MSKPSGLPRRNLVGTLAAAVGAHMTFPHIVSSSVLGRGGSVAPSDRISMGFIGTGNMGQGDMRSFLSSPDAQIVAVCDPIRWRREQAQHIANGAHGKQACAVYRDFRELLARADIDAVSIASLDSWHVLHALAAVRSGKDILVQKPLGMSIAEIMLLREEVTRRGRIFQFGTQQRSSKEFRLACELVRNGRIGKLRHINVGVHSGAPQERSGLKTIESEPVPEWLDYEMWLGPARSAPYTTARLTYPHWFHISDYSLGYVAGWGIHHIDIAQWGNDADATGPVEIEGKAVWPRNDALCDNPISWDVNLVYANGVTAHFTGSGPNFPGVKHGITFEGTEGWVFVNRGAIDASPKSLLQSTIGPNEVHLPVSSHHQQNFLDSIRSRARTICPIDVAVRSDTVCQLAGIAFKLGRKLKWDPEREEFTGDGEANRYLKRELRQPWRYSE
ncbi:MAG: Gfo/Idh/MocA family oxidoreductase [Acidobacteria bacterium]|nr:Gfo/Idh/MocA family oxidoreductase [Acidobacteriota bacterium]